MQMIKKGFVVLFFIFLLTVNSFGDIVKIELKPEEKKLIEQGEVIVYEIPTPHKNGRTFKAIGLINAEIDHVYKTLQDFKSYPEFMPNLDKIEVLEHKANSAILNYTLDLPLNKVKKYRLFTEFNQNTDDAVITWKLIPWPGLKESEKIKDTTGYWNFTIYPHKKGYVLAVYQVYTDPGPIPTGLGWIIDILTKNSVPDIVLNTRQRVHDLYHN
jgi:ribosome-associated toxin RatA of RatAB toxin-antitoxin module